MIIIVIITKIIIMVQISLTDMQIIIVKVIIQLVMTTITIEKVSTIIDTM